MKKLLSLLKLVPILALLSVFNAQAVPITIGTPTVNYSDVLFDGSSYSGEKTQIIITADELKNAGATFSGLIKSISFNMTSTDDATSPMNNFTVKMQNTTLQDLPTTMVSTGWTTCYTGTITQGVGVFEIPFTTNFNWDGTSNVLIDVCWKNTSTPYIERAVACCEKPGVKMAYYQSSSSTMCSSTLQTASGPAAPYMIFNYVALNKISSPAPAPNALLRNDMTYGAGSEYRPSIKITPATLDATTVVKYKIVGPKPSTEVVYEALANASDPTSTNISVPTAGVSELLFTAAKGIYSAANGALSFNNSADALGEYTVYTSIKTDASSPNGIDYPPYSIFVARPNDIVTKDITSPKDMNTSRYDYSQSIPISVKYYNKGVNRIASFTSNVKIYLEDAENPVYNETKTWEQTESNPFSSDLERYLLFPEFNPKLFGVGKYKMVVTTNLNNAEDNDLTNNNKTIYFRAANDMDIMAYSIDSPVDSMYLGTPVLPTATIVNNGVLDLPRPVKAFFTVKKIPTGETVYSASTTVETVRNLPDGYKTALYFNEALILTQPGTYQLALSIDVAGDKVPANNLLLDTLKISEGLSGVYTIGDEADATTAARNYLTIEAAVADLYKKGVTGAVEFRINKTPISVTSKDGDYPAIDLSSTIAGSSATNTIKFVPSDKFSGGSNPIIINLNSTNGIGILLGQNSISTNEDAIINKVSPSYKKMFANPTNYITFDGGINKSLRFNLNTTNTRKIAFYLAQGASNNVIKNCQVYDVSTTVDNNKLPKQKYNPSTSQYMYEDDNTLCGGIVMRSIAPYNAASKNKGNLNNLINLDTLVNKNNVIENNVIDGFGYGIVSIGSGVLEKKIGANFIHTMFYNSNNAISNNLITNSTFAGIFLGYNTNTTLLSNRIDLVGNANVDEAYGIMVGGTPRADFFGFNNVNITIDKNEISNIKGNSVVTGILNDQSLNSYYTPASTLKFPNVNERVIISNNIVRGLAALNNKAVRTGVAIVTSRDASGKLYDGTYRAKNNVIVNNTIKMDADDMQNDAFASCIELKQVSNTKVVNNLLLNVDNDNYGVNGSSALISYNGQLPLVANNQIERNVYYYNTSAKNDIVRLKETDEVSNEYDETGYINEFKNLDQWKYWTKQDNYSFWYAKAPEELVVNSGDKLRIKLLPEAPMNSKLNNNGFLNREIMVDNNTLLSQLIDAKDIDGNDRGAADARYDIGASEFQGLVHLNDIEVMAITAPATYKSAVNEFSDINYVMTEGPVDVKAMIRNNGNLPARNVRVKATIYREKKESANLATPEYETVGQDYFTYVNLDSYGNAEVSFNLADKQAPDFNPETFYEKKNLYTTIPAKFETMKYNVTPRYRIVVSVEEDQDMYNNEIKNDYRFFMKKASLSMIISAENTTLDVANTDFTTYTDAQFGDKIAGKLNFNALNNAFKSLGWKQDREIEPKVPDYDVFDRTAWEPRAVNYTNYKSLFWSDGNDLDKNGNPRFIVRTEEYDIKNFLANKSFSATDWAEKKNLVFASQELLRNNKAVNKETFIKEAFKAFTINNNSPLGLNATYNNKTVKGVGLGINQVLTLKNTGFAKNGKSDSDPIPALMTRHKYGDGVTIPAFYYNNIERNAQGAPLVIDSLAGVATSALTKNVVYLGADWRHWDNIDVLLRSVMDYTNKNGSDIVPVEIMDFDAIDRNNTVEIGWTTTFEHLTDRFEIERADVNEAGISDFRTIATEKAVGESKNTTSYGPVLDKEVKAGASYIYRLKAIDVTGETSYSDKVEVTIDANNTLNEITPNPVSANAEVSFNVNGEQNIEVSIYDVTGKKVKDVYTGIANGQKSITINVNDLVNGTYTVVMKSDKQVLSTRLYVRK